MENQKFQHRSIIKFLVLEGQSPSNIHERMTAVYGDTDSSLTMVFEWARPFKNGQLKIEDRPRSGRPISATNEKNIKAVEKLIVEDRQITIQEIAEIFFLYCAEFCSSRPYIFFSFCMIFEGAYESSVNNQDYDNKQRKNYKEEKTNRMKIEIEAVMTTKACITVLLCLFFRYRISLTLITPCRGKESNLLMSD